jgi:hypothetical protein
MSGGFMYHCHRCHTSGAVYDDRLDPRQTLERANSYTIDPGRMKKDINLPPDMMWMSDYNQKEAIPYEAYNHLWKYGLGEKQIQQFSVGWSPTWNRLIFPLYEYGVFNNVFGRKFVGWVGRDVKWTKESKYPKWLTRTQRGTRRYFMAPGEDEQYVVLVEDSISAIKVWMATKYTCIGLLNAYVDRNLMTKLRDKEKVYLWLDGNMQTNSINTVTCMRELGINAKHIHTPKDPKEYNTLAIATTLRMERGNEDAELPAVYEEIFEEEDLMSDDDQYAIEGN